MDAGSVVFIPSDLYLMANESETRSPRRTTRNSDVKEAPHRFQDTVQQQQLDGTAESIRKIGAATLRRRHSRLSSQKPSKLKRRDPTMTNRSHTGSPKSCNSKAMLSTLSPRVTSIRSTHPVNSAVPCRTNPSVETPGSSQSVVVQDFEAETEALSKYIVPQRRRDEEFTDQLPETSKGQFTASWIRRLSMQPRSKPGTVCSSLQVEVETLASLDNPMFWSDTDLNLIERLHHFLTGRPSYQDWESGVSRWLANGQQDPHVCKTVLWTATAALSRLFENPWLFMLRLSFTQLNGTMNLINLSLGDHSTAVQAEDIIDSMLSKLKYNDSASCSQPFWHFNSGESGNKS